MKKLILCLLVICPGYLFAQIGIKAGLNFANVTGASSINSSSRSGFQAGVFLGGGGKKSWVSVTSLPIPSRGMIISREQIRVL